MSETTLASLNPPGSEGCPPPLAWQEVVQGVEEQGRPFSIAAGRLELDGLSIGDGPPLWFLTGLAGDRRLFSLLAWLLRDRFQCLLADVTWDQPPAPSTLVHETADLLAAACSNLRLDRPAFFGTSIGAQIALAVLHRHPGLARGVVVQAGFARRRVSLTERLLAWGAGKSAKRLREFPGWRQIQEANHRRWFPPIDVSRWDFLLDSLGDTTARRWSNLARAAAATDLRAVLHEISAPVQLIRTEGDGPVAAAAMNELIVGLPNVQEETLHTSGHFAFLTHPHRVAKIVANFLQSTL